MASLELFGSTKAATTLPVTPLLFPGEMTFAGNCWLHVHQWLCPSCPPISWAQKSISCCGLQERLSQTLDVALSWRHEPSPSSEKPRPCLSHEWDRLVLCMMAFRNTVHIGAAGDQLWGGWFMKSPRDRECLGTRKLKAVIYMPNAFTQEADSLLPTLSAST